jgi:hypothetical protein
MQQTPGGPKEFDVEGPSVIQLRRENVTPSTLKPGDKVLIRANPMKDGRPGGSLVDIRMPDGRVVIIKQVQ